MHGKLANLEDTLTIVPGRTLQPDAESEGPFRGNVLARFKRSMTERVVKPMQKRAVA